ncbi:hypothetical protein C8R47DRAFT_492859 [Mycena vitilis]|nr:hypothetical protein C8R47DRAFT_492859 [Mycena vitilis]
MERSCSRSLPSTTCSSPSPFLPTTKPPFTSIVLPRARRLRPSMGKRSLYPILPTHACSLPTHHAVQSDSWNMHKFSQVEWQLLSVGNKERSSSLGSGRKITASLITWTQFTLAQFSKAAKPLVSPIDGDGCYVLVPKHGPLRGMLPNDPTNHIHVCFPFHVLATVPGTPYHDVAHVVCHPRCHPPPLIERQASRALPVAHLTRQATSFTHPTASSTPLFIADDDDLPEEEREARDMERAIRQSLEAAPPPPDNHGTSNAVAGPSTLSQPSTQAGTRRVRSPSVEAIDPLEPPFQRRRRGTNAVPQDVIAAFANKSIPGLHTWQAVLTTVLDNTPVRFQGPSVHSLVNTLLGRIRAIFGGDEWFPENPVDSSTITAPAGPLGLLTTNTTWIAGESSGEGVGKTVMEELMNTIFADENIWKKVAQNGQDLVIDVLPQGFPLEQDRRILLQTYGYACMLYMIYRCMLPKALSTLFACAILSPDGETELLKDKTFLRLIAPAQMEALDHWPSDSKQTEFGVERPSNGLYYLANTFFEKQPVYFSTVSSHTLAAYTNFLYRKVFIGTDTCLKDSPEISLFARTFNSRLNSHSPVTFAHTFGVSLRSMMTKMCAMRLQSVPDLLDRLTWVSTLKPELQELEGRYKAAFTRYISLPGIVEHPLLPAHRLTELERQLPRDHMLARALMYMMTATGTQQLPAARGTINMVFHPHLETTTDLMKKDPVQNPETWPDFISQVQTHTCFDGADLPLRGMEFLLRQPIPEDNTATDFDLYQYMMYRPITQFAEFGGLM